MQQDIPSSFKTKVGNTMCTNDISTSSARSAASAKKMRFAPLLDLDPDPFEKKSDLIIVYIVPTNF